MTFLNCESCEDLILDILEKFGEVEHLISTAMANLKDGDYCNVIGGTHKGKSGTVRDLNTSKTGQLTITVVQRNGERFKTLAKNVAVTK